MDYKHLITLISDWIITLPLLLGAVFFRRIDVDSKLILLIVIAGTIPQMIHFFYVDSNWKNFSYNLYSPIEWFIYLLLFYRKIYLHYFKKVFLFTIIISLATTLFSITDYNWFERFINEWTLVNNITYLVWAGLVITQAFIHDTEIITTGQPFFWYLTGILIYATCTTVVYSLWHRIAESDKHSVLRYLWTIQNLFNILLYILFTKGIWMDVNPSKPAFPNQLKQKDGQ